MCVGGLCIKILAQIPDGTAVLEIREKWSDLMEDYADPSEYWEILKAVVKSQRVCVCILVVCADNFELCDLCGGTSFMCSSCMLFICVL